ncbi:hypothetical protein B9Q11_01170 [Candidatus Marsarchaeota G2 archaeon ECH_B_SAG-F08]|uniref:Uncharacterized protein n=1 Tax=Candidatus Marsarchaeota G2 archaeon ECH_B_SAG-F08 TaxID=1978165 RepID=A0A2R6BKR3_9ARCH|nr:MAG: hypothetical protein B9Q11_01170 [Candidatus Marsarchaeota G2 archaeon ECH_B_SAG-F08]
MKDEKFAIVFSHGIDTTHVFAKLAESGIIKDTSLIFDLSEENSPRVLSNIATIDSHIATLNSHGFSLSTYYCRVNEHDFTGSLKKSLIF